MGSKHSNRRTFSEDFILTLLREYYSSEVSINFICRKYNICSASFYQWQKKYDLDGKKLSLSHDIITKVKAMRSKKDMEKSALSREEELEAQVSNLKKALEYSELRNQGLMKVIEISSKEYGEDLLKKAGAKQ